MGLDLRKPDFVYANKKGADQPEHSHSLISTFVISYVEIIIVNLIPCKISIFSIVSVTEQGILKFMTRINFMLCLVELS